MKNSFNRGGNVVPSDMDAFLESSQAKILSQNEIGIIFYGEDDDLEDSQDQEMTAYIVKKEDLVKWAKELEFSEKLNPFYKKSSWSNKGAPFRADIFISELFDDGDNIDACEAGALEDALKHNVIPCRKVEVDVEFDLDGDNPELIEPESYRLLFSEYIRLY